ncbi:hypothetical protein [Delftia tsuruhatensis]|uniref:hypothetical protein n=1 Tax=Delftia tsuruhatensis TaxID=180282 RepID=UPI0023D9EEE2|nr:hypothetical protein [Delftia tsuruhatensis]WEM00102.1 hypothetical protein PW274_07390 [Delftia tsuruhatensis]
MAGLLDFLSSPDAQLGLGLLAAAGSGQRFGPGLLGAVQYSNEARRAMDDQSFQKRQRDQQTKAWDLQDQENALAQQFFRPGQAALAPLAGDSASGILPSQGRPATPGSFDMQGYANAVMGVNPLRGMQLLQSMQKELPVDKIDPTKFTPGSLAKFAQSRNYGDLVPRNKLEFVNDIAVDPYDPANVNRSLPNPNKPFQVDAQGNAVPNKAYQNYEISKAAAGAARTSNNISVNTEKSFLNEIAKGAGSQLDASLAGAKGAQSTISTLNNLDSAINSGKVMAGPLTAPAQVLMQVGTQLGLGGKSSKETLEKTRAAMQAMAQLELDAASQMKGQGQITESERAILRKAASGDISMSIGEIKTLSQVARKTAENRIRQHNQNVAPLLSNPNAGALAPFLTVPQPEAAQAPAGGGVVDFSSLK